MNTEQEIEQMKELITHIIWVLDKLTTNQEMLTDELQKRDTYPNTSNGN